MPRPMRIEYQGAKYHILSRGDRHEDIVFDDEDRNNSLRSLLPELPQKAPSIIDSAAPNVVKTF